MSLTQLHLLFNHWPIIGTFIGLGLFAIAQLTNRDELKQAGLGLFSLLALAAIPAYLTGNGAQEMLKDLPEISMEMIEAHQGAALLSFISMEITGVVSLFGLWRFSRTVKNPWMSQPARMNLWAVLILAVITGGLMAVTGNTGGNIRHPEIVSVEEPPAAAAIGSRLVPSLQYFVIDYSMWVWPLLEDLHFMGLILILATVGLLNLRILGFLKQLPVAPIHRFLPFGIAGFAINVITGFLFYIGMPAFYIVNVVFQIKMVALLLAGTTALLFYCTSSFRILEQVGPGEDAPLSAKIIAAASIFLWLAVILLGRYIPFGEVT